MRVRAREQSARLREAIHSAGPTSPLAELADLVIRHLDTLEAWRSSRVGPAWQTLDEARQHAETALRQAVGQPAEVQDADAALVAAVRDLSTATAHVSDPDWERKVWHRIQTQRAAPPSRWRRILRWLRARCGNE